MLPAVGQGIVAVECAAQDWQTRRILAAIDDPSAHKNADAEREVLWVLNGHCNSPIAGFSTIDGTQMSLTASVLDEAGGLFIEASRSGPADRPRELGRAVELRTAGQGCSRDYRAQPAGVTDRGGFHKYRRHHPRTRMIQYSETIRFQYTAAITGYPLEPVIGLAKGETRWRIDGLGLLPHPL